VRIFIAEIKKHIIMQNQEVKTEKRGRKPGTKKVEVVFSPELIKTYRGSDLKFNDQLFIPMKTGSELDVIFSTEGGLMPATNMMLCGGPGSGKTTITLDVLSNLTNKGLKCLFVSGEMDEIGYFKYCKRMPHIQNVETLFLKNYSETVKPTLEYMFDQGYDVIAIDSIAEVIGMYKDCYGGTETSAEFWLLNLQDKNKKGNNQKEYFTTFINIQQVTKSGDFVGSNRLKHMMDAQAIIEKSKDGLERTIHFDKNRDCDKDFKMYFSITKDGVFYTYEMITE
jgi:predicted ATP-dependent serine protease